MTLAASSSDQQKELAKKGVKMPKISSGMVKTPPLDLATQKQDDKSKADTSKKKKKDDASLIGKAKKQFITARTVESKNRKEGLEDLRFLDGDQWAAADAAARAADGRPCITENRLPTFANQIKNDQRQNRPAIVISPMGDKASKKDAKFLRGMIRAIERDSHADVAYDTGFASSVDNGWGYWRIMTEYESEDSFNKVLVVKPLINPFNVYLDNNRTPHMLDAEWGFITEMVPREEFEREYPDSSITPWSETGIGESDKEWITQDEIRVAEYYYFKREERKLVSLDNEHIGWEDELDQSVKDKISSGSIEVVEERWVSVKKLKWVKMTAIEILDSSDCDGQYIPIIECNGTVININGKLSKKGLIRDAKGPQRISNYYKTLEAELIGLQPKAPWIMEEGQIEGHEEKWKAANRKSYSYLLYKGTSISGKPAPPPQRQAFQGPPAAVLAGQQGTIEALKAVTGIRFDATMSERMADESGKALRHLEQNANLGAYHYIDNYGRALKNTGIILCDLIPIIYDTKRIVSMLDEAGNEDRVMIYPNMAKAHAEVEGMSPESDQPTKIKLFNPKIGRYQVTVTIGPSFATKRIEAAESQLGFMKAVPQLAPIIADLVAKNSDWEGSEEIAARIAKSIPPNYIVPNKDDLNPQIEALISGLHQQLQQQSQQINAMGKELQDRQKDRDVAEHGIMKTFEAKVLAIAQKMEQTTQDASVKREAHLQSTIGRQLQEISKAVQSFEQTTKQPKQ